MNKRKRAKEKNRRKFNKRTWNGTYGQKIVNCDLAQDGTEQRVYFSFLFRIYVSKIK